MILVHYFSIVFNIYILYIIFTTGVWFQAFLNPLNLDLTLTGVFKGFDTPLPLSKPILFFNDVNGALCMVMLTIWSPLRIINPKLRLSSAGSETSFFFNALTAFLGTRVSSQSDNTTFMCLSKASKLPIKLLLSIIVTFNR